MNLFRNYEKEFEDLQKSISTIGDMVSFQETNVRSDIAKLNKNQNEFESELTALYEKQDEIFEQLKEIKALLNPPKTDVPDIDVEITYEKDTDPTEEEVYFGGKKITTTAKKDFQYTEILPQFNFKYVDKRNRAVFSKFTMFDIAIVMNIEEEATWNSWSELSRMTGLHQNYLKRIAYNIKKGFFDKFDFNEVISFSKEYGLLYVNGKKTSVTIKTARYIVDCMINSNNPMTTLLKVEKAGEIAKAMYRLIGTNYKNPQLTSLLYDEVHIPIENNPQKRKEMGM